MNEKRYVETASIPSLSNLFKFDSDSETENKNNDNCILLSHQRLPK